MSGPELRALFFTSIPKAGKNLVYSFLGELGYVRPEIAREAAVWWTEREWLHRAGRQCTYALPPPVGQDEGNLESACRSFLSQLVGCGPRQVVHHHIAFNEAFAGEIRRAKMPAVFLCRDPRDVLLSMADYILVQRKPLHLAGRFAALGRSDLVTRLWNGDEYLVGLPDYFAAFARWRTAPGVLALRFEEVVGEAGGGTASEQQAALRRLAQELGLTNESRLARACAATFNPRAGTFYKGRAGRWREETDDRIAGLLKSRGMTKLAEDWGYPAD